MEKIIIFDEVLDHKLLDMNMDDTQEKIYKKYVNGVSIESLIYHEKDKYDELDNALLKALADAEFSLQEAMIGRICDTCTFGDYQTMIMTNKFVLSVGYYSAGDNIAHYSLYKWDEDSKHFDSESFDFIDLTEISTKERKEK